MIGLNLEKGDIWIYTGIQKFRGLHDSVAAESIIVKLLNLNGWILVWQWSRGAECWGTVTGLSLRGEFARCWQNLIFACFLVLPIYDSQQESQVNLYIMLEHNEAGSLSLNRKNDEILNE